MFLHHGDPKITSTCKPTLRKFEVIATADAQDGWQIETRKRLSGKMKNYTYKVFIDPHGTKYYSLAKAVQVGFKASAADDGRKTRHQKIKKMKSKAE